MQNRLTADEWSLSHTSFHKHLLIYVSKMFALFSRILVQAVSDTFFIHIFSYSFNILSYFLSLFMKFQRRNLYQCFIISVNQYWSGGVYFYVLNYPPAVIFVRYCTVQDRIYEIRLLYLTNSIVSCFQQIISSTVTTWRTFSGYRN